MTARFYSPLLLAGLLFPMVLIAQEPSAEQLLNRMRASNESSIAGLPDVSCDEHMTSSQIHDGKTHNQIVVDSTVTAIRAKDIITGFREHHSVKTVNGRPWTKGKVLHPPFSLYNTIGDTYDLYLSPEHALCNSYSSQETTQDGIKAFRLDVHVPGDAAKLASPACQKERPGTSVSFWMAEDTGRLLRVHVDMPDGGSPTDYNHFIDDIEFAPVQFGDKTVALPVAINALATNDKPGDNLLFRSLYSNCHRFIVTTTILPDTSEPLK